MRELLRRLHYLLHRDRYDRELADEMAFHQEMARRDGGQPFGNARRLREESREAWGWMWIERTGQDLRYAARTLRRAPGFTVAAILTLAVGIGVNVAAFGFVNVAFLKPLPVREPGSLLGFERRSPDRFASRVPYPEARFMRDHSRTLSAVLVQHPANLSWTGDDRPFAAQFVSEDYFTELGIAPRLGRVLQLERDAATDAEPVAVLSHTGWLRRFGGDPGVVGRVVTLNNQPVTIVGVTAAGFGGLTLDDPDAWLPINRHPQLIKGSRLLTDFSSASGGVAMWGRMRAGVSAPVVEEELRGLAASLREQEPQQIWENERLVSTPAGRPNRGGGSSEGTGTPGPSKFYAIAGLIGALVLLILTVACANLGGLLVARGVARQREIAIRASVGASRLRLLRQLFTESLVLASLGAAAGAFVGHAILRAVLTTTGAPEWLDVTPDWRTIACAAAMAVITAVLFGLAPAWQIARGRHRSTIARQFLIGTQVAASCILLVVAGLLVRALDRMLSQDVGFDYQQVIAVSPGLQAHGYDADRAAAYLETLDARLRALPGVDSVVRASNTPLGRKTMVARIVVDDRAIDMHVNHVDPGYFAALRIPIQRGRPFEPGEHAAVVSESLGRSLWPGKDPLGQTFDGRTVVGIAGNARQTALQDPDAVEGYFPITRDQSPSLSLLVRTAMRPEDVLRAVTAATSSLDADLFPDVQMLKAGYQRRVDQTELTAAAVGLLGTSAMVLACLGIVGLVAYSVAQRAKEIGIRMALGASRSHVLAVVLRQLARPLVLGLVAGLLAAGGLAQVLRRELYGVSTLDPVAYLAPVALFVATGALAAWWPARRALRVDPLHALRCD